MGGNISNDPHIEFDNAVANTCGASTFPTNDDFRNVCNTKVFLCGNIGYSNSDGSPTAVGIDQFSFELFKYGSGSNPLDPASTPPQRTFFINNPGVIPTSPASGVLPGSNFCSPLGFPACGYCVLWDGNINILGDLGKSNGTYGFRATVKTNITSASAGNISVEQTQAYPYGATYGANCNSNLPVSQKPITVDVTNVHVVRTTTTIVGGVTGVAAEPYNITYRLSKDSNVSLQVTDSGSTLIRTIVPGLPRVGEGTPDGSLQNGDAWNGRADNGDFLLPGNYLAYVRATSADQYGTDVSAPYTRQISLDPLQITDILVQPLTSLSTSLAVITYTLTEPATAYVDIYPPGTQFCAVGSVTDPINSVNNSALDTPTEGPAIPAKNFGAHLNSCAGPSVSPVRRYFEQKDFRKPVVTFWDGRDFAGNLQPDGDYVFVLYAAMPSQNGTQYRGLATDMRIWTSTAKNGFISISRGLVSISQITPATTVIGSSPPVAGLAPYIFSYSLSRDAVVGLKIYDSSGQNLIRTLVTGQIRPGNFLNRDLWPDGFDDNGNIVSSGTYLVQLTAADPFFPTKITTTTALFPVDLFRITDVLTSSLLTGATEVVTFAYQLSYGMNVGLNIYPPGTQIKNAATSWPPCGSITPGVCANIVSPSNTPVAPVITINGMRPARLRVTEFWDGRDINGLFVPDGTYVFTLTAQSTTTPKYFADDRVFGTITIARGSVVFPSFTIKPTVPPLFNSSQTVTLPPFEMDYTLTRQSSVTIKVLDTNLPPNIMRTVILGQIRDANVLNQDFWDGRDDRGNFVRPGFYTVQATAVDLASVLSSGSTVQQTVAVNPLRIYDVAISPLSRANNTALISYQISETMKVAIKIYKPGTTFDPAGNPSPPERISLVRRIIGVRPSRTEVNDFWDGKDETLTLVPDGNYIFRIIGSTDTGAIDSITGAVTPGASLASDLVVAEIPVVRGQSVNAEADFENNTFVYPNPVNTPQATFSIYLPFQSDLQVKIFDFAGELVYQQDFPNQPKSSDNGPKVLVWPRVNNSNRKVAPGIYFVLVREKETLGGANLLQTVKKIVLQ